MNFNDNYRYFFNNQMIQQSIKFILDQFEFFFPKDEFMNLDASKQSLSYEENT